MGNVSAHHGGQHGVGVDGYGDGVGDGDTPAVQCTAPRMEGEVTSLQ